MEKSEVLTALDRIEAALSRIDAVLPTLLDRAASGKTPQPVQDPQLAQRHENLKRSVAQSLSELDDLLAGRG
ncbi:hypothetical protein [Novosphingobium sp. Leaf2]|uniref:hypothetical protein n=1 Tax=Novosphingobium sp. Leaf2 TaxID=1735670 RepID=UPI0006F6A5F2|nr:hypothetical protein [Novosphingobium sp. Leaf2]KQM13075.1 hypothetical protein ASE49_13895 [Novosphingobium sp. Leaf2]